MIIMVVFFFIKSLVLTSFKFTAVNVGLLTLFNTRNYNFTKKLTFKSIVLYYWVYPVASCILSFFLNKKYYSKKSL